MATARFRTRLTSLMVAGVLLLAGAVTLIAPAHAATNSAPQIIPPLQ